MLDILMGAMWAGIGFAAIVLGIVLSVIVTFVVACIGITAWVGDDA
jgi:hypothetical protein